MTQIGVVSFGNECAHPDYPGVYTRIPSVLGWLSRYTGEETVWNFECEAVSNPDGKIFGMRQKNHINTYHPSDSCYWRRSWRGPSRHCQQIAGSRGVVCCQHPHVPHLHAPSPARHQISPHAGWRPRLRRLILNNFHQCSRSFYLCAAVRRGWRLGPVTQPPPDQVPSLQLAVPGWSAPIGRCLPWHWLHYGTALI